MYDLWRSRDLPVPPAKKLMYSAAAKSLARFDEGDCHTHSATKSLVASAMKFRRRPEVSTKFVLNCG